VEEAYAKYRENYENLPNRPDYDGYLAKGHSYVSLILMKSTFSYMNRKRIICIISDNGDFDLGKPGGTTGNLLCLARNTNLPLSMKPVLPQSVPPLKEGINDSR
jgi:hypothetical protein